MVCREGRKGDERLFGGLFGGRVLGEGSALGGPEQGVLKSSNGRTCLVLDVTAVSSRNRGKAYRIRRSMFYLIPDIILISTLC